MKDKILITGATGTTGSQVVKFLLKQGYDNIRLCVRDTSKAKRLGWGDLDLAVTDYSDDYNLEEVVYGIDKIYLVPVGTDPKEKIATSCKLLDAAKKSGVQHVVHLSSISANDDPNSPHRAIEEYLKEQGFDYTNMRLNFFMQNFSNYYLDEIKNNHLIGIYAGNAKTSFVDCRDVGEAVAKILIDSEPHLNKSYEITGPKSLTHEEVAKILSFETGLNVKYEAYNEDDSREYFRACGWPESMIERMLVIYEHTRAGWFESVFDDLEEILDRPTRTFNQYAQDYAKCFL